MADAADRIATPPQWVAKKLDARHAHLGATIDNLIAIAERCIEDRAAGAAREAVDLMREAEAERDRIESHWVPA